MVDGNCTMVHENKKKTLNCLLLVFLLGSFKEAASEFMARLLHKNTQGKDEYLNILNIYHTNLCLNLGQSCNKTNKNSTFFNHHLTQHDYSQDSTDNDSFVVVFIHVSLYHRASIHRTLLV